MKKLKNVLSHAELKAMEKEITRKGNYKKAKVFNSTDKRFLALVITLDGKADFIVGEYADDETQLKNFQPKIIEYSNDHTMVKAKKIFQCHEHNDYLEWEKEMERIEESLPPIPKVDEWNQLI